MPRVFIVTASACVLAACQSSPPTVASMALHTAVVEAEPAPFPHFPFDSAASGGLEASADSLAVTAADSVDYGPESPYPNLARKAGISLGVGAYSHFDTSVRVDSGALIGAVVDLEETLDVDQSSDVGRLDAFYSFSPRHQIDFSYYDISRGGVRTIGEDIQIGEVILPDGFAVDTSFDTTIFKLDYRYNFVSDVRTRIGASFGIHGMRFDAKFVSAAGSIEESFKATVPLPLLGLHFEYALSPKWKLLSSVELLQVDLGPYSGFFSDRRLTIEHDAFDHFGWGIGYNGFSLDAEIEGEGNLESKVNMEYQGLLLYLRWYF